MGQVNVNPGGDAPPRSGGLSSVVMIALVILVVLLVLAYFVLWPMLSTPRKRPASTSTSAPTASLTVSRRCWPDPLRPLTNHPRATPVTPVTGVPIGRLGRPRGRSGHRGATGNDGRPTPLPRRERFHHVATTAGSSASGSRRGDRSAPVVGQRWPRRWPGPRDGHRLPGGTPSGPLVVGWPRPGAAGHAAGLAPLARSAPGFPRPRRREEPPDAPLPPGLAGPPGGLVPALAAGPVHGLRLPRLQLLRPWLLLRHCWLCAPSCASTSGTPSAPTGVLSATLGVAGTLRLCHLPLAPRRAGGSWPLPSCCTLPYAFQTNLFKRADLPEALGLALHPVAAADHLALVDGPSDAGAVWWTIGARPSPGPPSCCCTT